MTDSRLEPLQRSASDHGVAVLVGASVRLSKNARALALLSCTATGEVSVAYSKQHLWQEEQAIFTAGTEGASVELRGWMVGLGICYDGCFPEHARAASDAGAVGYVCPSAYVVGSGNRRDLYYAARALDNGVYVVVAGLTGRCGGLLFSGGTAVYDPQAVPLPGSTRFAADPASVAGSLLSTHDPATRRPGARLLCAQGDVHQLHAQAVAREKPHSGSRRLELRHHAEAGRRSRGATRHRS